MPGRRKKDDLITLVYDLKKYAVACVIIQSAAGCPSEKVLEFGFHTNTWLEVSTSGMRLLSGTEAEWKELAYETNAAWAGKDASTTILAYDVTRKKKK